MSEKKQNIKLMLDELDVLLSTLIIHELLLVQISVTKAIVKAIP